MDTKFSTTSNVAVSATICSNYKKIDMFFILLFTNFASSAIRKHFGTPNKIIKTVINIPDSFTVKSIQNLSTFMNSYSDHKIAKKC